MSTPGTKPSAVLHRDLKVEPLEVLSAKGPYLTLSDGRKIIDATGGAAVSCLGHGNRRVQKVISDQVGKLDYCHSMFFSNLAIEDLSQFLVDASGGQMARAFIVNSGSEAMDAAMKMARQYFMEMVPPQPNRIRFIARSESYHGNTLGALGMSGHKARRAIYEPMLSPLVTHVAACNAYRGLRAEETVQDYVKRLASELDAEFQRVGPDTVCAFVAEPVVGAALGCVPSLPGYFKAMKKICDKYGALLILDEVMSGMGRTGTLYAWEQEDVVPDLQTMGKGLGGGYVPIAGLMINHRVIDVLEKGTGRFMHGQTYQGHPMVCAAALEVQRIIQEENLLSNVVRMGVHLEQALKEAFQSQPHVGNIRGRGLFWGLEFVKDKQTKEPFDPALGLAVLVHNEALAQEPGLMLYPGSGTVDGRRGDHVLLAPPYNVSAEMIDMIVEGARRAIDSVFEKLSTG